LESLSAGLTHELNNPAAAIVRSSPSLLEHLQLEPNDFKEIMAIRMEEKEVDAVNKKIRSAGAARKAKADVDGTNRIGR
jgi:hypothetical protein